MSRYLTAIGAKMLTDEANGQIRETEQQVFEHLIQKIKSTAEYGQTGFIFQCLPVQMIPAIVTKFEDLGYNVSVTAPESSSANAVLVTWH